MISRVTNWLNGQDSRYIFLLLLLVVLPSFEAPKNLFALLYVVSWLVIAYREKNWGGKWRIIDTVILFFFFGNIVVSLNAVITYNLSAGGMNDLIRFLLIVWVLSRHILTKNQIVTLCMVAVFSTAISLIYSYLMCPPESCPSYLELYSVGHVNHTAIYLVIAYSIALSLLLTNFFVLLNYQRVLLILSTLFIAYAAIDSNSRAASGILVLVTSISLSYAVFKYKSSRFRLGVLSFLIFSSFLVISNPPSVIEKFKTSESLFDEPERKKIRNFAYYTFKTSPLLGVGFGNFGNLRHEYIKDKVIEDLGVFEKEKYSLNAHTHNVYYNFLVSGGIVMLSALLWFWIQIIVSIWKVSKENDRKELRYIDDVEVIEYRDDRLLILSSSMVFLIVLSMGFVNTTLSHEHAILSMFVLGLLLSKDRELNAK